MNNVNGGQPQNESFVMTAPSQISNKRDDVKLLEVGVNVGILYSMIDLGTHYNDYFKKRQRLIRLTFEFPFLKQLFRTTDTEERPTVVSMEETYQMAPKSNLKKFCDGALGRVLSEHEYSKGQFDIGQFLGKVMIVNIINKPSKKDPTVIYNNIDSVNGITERVKSMYKVDWHLVQRTNPLQGFMIGDGSNFATTRFSSLPHFIREKLKESDEGKIYAQNGGVFAEPEENEITNTAQQVAQPVQRTPLQTEIQTPISQGVPVSPSRTLVWLNQTYTYAQLTAKGWTDDLLVENGYAKWEEALAPMPPAVPQVPEVPQVPQVPNAPITQSTNPVEMRIDGDGNLADLSQGADGLDF